MHDSTTWWSIRWTELYIRYCGSRPSDDCFNRRHGTGSDPTVVQASSSKDKEDVRCP